MPGGLPNERLNKNTGTRKPMKVSDTHAYNRDHFEYLM